MNPRPAGDFSEDELLAALRKVLSGEGPEVLVGPGDDAAVLEQGGGLASPPAAGPNRTISRYRADRGQYRCQSRHGRVD